MTFSQTGLDAPRGPRVESAPRGPADAAPAPSAVRRLGALAMRVGRSIRWYITTLMGDRAYDTYVAHHRRAHPGEEPLTERQFWRERMDDQDRNPGARCC